jgi:hypothetical protein
MNSSPASYTNPKMQLQQQEGRINQLRQEPWKMSPLSYTGKDALESMTSLQPVNLVNQHQNYVQSKMIGKNLYLKELGLQTQNPY